MAEAFSFSEGVVALSTGAAFATSGVMAYCENTTLNLQYGWVNTPSLSGVYYDHLTGWRANVNIGAVLTTDNSITEMVQSRTAVHMKVFAANALGSGGFLLYSGRIDALTIQGQKAGVFMYTLSYHANQWSAW